MAEAQASEKAKDKPRSADAYLKEIDAALKREDKWRKRGKEVVKRFRDERDSHGILATTGLNSKVNILWSNTEVLKAALYSRTAIPDVRRRFTDARNGDPAGRAAAEVLERALSYCADAYDIDKPMEAAVEDLLLPGRGTAWVRYEPEIEGEGDDAKITEQKLDSDYVYWEDFCHGLSRTWKNVPWVARRHAMTVTEFKTKFPEAKANPNYALETASNDGTQDSGDDKFVEVWEQWWKPTKERLWLGRGYEEILQADPDPYKLTEFFPCPEPLYSVTTTDRLIPEPEYCQYQDQARQLDDTDTRITVLTGQLVWKGIYDGSIDGENILSTLAAAGDGEFLPYANWMALKDKGGIESAVGFWPMDRIITVLQQLYLQRDALIQTIYQVTGISDIIRGSTDPRETKGAQQLKAQFGSMRMQRRQRAVQKFIRDDHRIKGEIIAEHFTQETLAAITGMDLPTREEQEQFKAQMQMAAQQAAMQPPPPPQMAPPGPPQGNGAQPPAPPPPQMGMGQPPMPQAAPQAPPELIQRMSGASWDDVMEILRSDKLRGYRVDIETDSTTLVDAEAEKAGRIEMMTAMQGLLQGGFAMIQASPGTIPLVEQLVMFGLRSFKPGRALEESFEDAFEELKKNPPKPEGKEQAPPEMPDKAGEMKAMAAAEEVKRKAARDQADIQIEGGRLKLDTEVSTREQDRADAELKIDTSLGAREQDRADVAFKTEAELGEVDVLIRAGDSVAKEKAAIIKAKQPPRPPTRTQ